MFAAFLRNFSGSLVFTVLCLALGAGYEWQVTHSLEATLAQLWIVVVLAVLEISLSFDNAVVNASILGQMEAVWRKRFLTWGMLIAVFGTRIAFPLAIVGFSAGLGPSAAIHLSLVEPARYEAIVTHAHLSIAGFGGAFLGLVGLGFFMNPEKDVHWLGWLEARLKAAGALKAGEVVLVLVALLGIAHGLDDGDARQFLVGGLLGIVSYIAVESIGALLEGRETARAMAGAAVKSGLASFLYLNMLDASFSLDGVIGAFALSNNMVIIALGLSVGAIYVRSLTLLLVKHGALNAYRYLEHGAFWAILALAVIMLGSAVIEVPAAVTGLIGAVLIAASLGWSLRHKRVLG